MTSTLTTMWFCCQSTKDLNHNGSPTALFTDLFCRSPILLKAQYVNLVTFNGNKGYDKQC